MDAEKSKEILDKHAAWLRDEPGGERANLREANLRGASGIISIGPGGSRSDMLYAVKHEADCMVKAGCFWGTLAEFAAAVEAKHGDNPHGVYYRAVIAMLRVWYEA